MTKTAELVSFLRDNEVLSHHAPTYPVPTNTFTEINGLKIRHVEYNGWILPNKKEPKFNLQSS